MDRGQLEIGKVCRIVLCGVRVPDSVPDFPQFAAFLCNSVQELRPKAIIFQCVAQCRNLVQ
jgi:hypothetical protein